MSRLFLVATALALIVTPVTAQNPNVREGFWYGFGFGVGSGELHCDICNDQSGTDLAASVRAGWVLSPAWLLGGELDGWTNSQDVASRRSWSLSAVALWYPWKERGAYVKGSLGLTGYRASDSVDVISTTRAGGIIPYRDSAERVRRNIRDNSRGCCRFYVVVFRHYLFWEHPILLQD